ESLTKWEQDEAVGRPLGEIFHIISEKTRRPLESPIQRILRQGSVLGLANHTVLIARDGTERSIDDSAAPTRNAEGKVLGVILVFRDVTEKRLSDKALA